MRNWLCSDWLEILEYFQEIMFNPVSRYSVQMLVVVKCNCDISNPNQCHQYIYSFYFGVIVTVGVVNLNIYQLSSNFLYVVANVVPYCFSWKSFFPLSLWVAQVHLILPFLHRRPNALVISFQYRTNFFSFSCSVSPWQRANWDVPHERRENPPSKPPDAPRKASASPQLSRIRNDHGNARPSRLAPHLFDGSHHVHARNHSSEDDVFAIQPGRFRGAEKELRSCFFNLQECIAWGANGLLDRKREKKRKISNNANRRMFESMPTVGIFSGIGHAQYSRTGVFQLQSVWWEFQHMRWTRKISEVMQSGILKTNEVGIIIEKVFHSPKSSHLQTFLRI